MTKTDLRLTLDHHRNRRPFVNLTERSSGIFLVRLSNSRNNDRFIPYGHTFTVESKTRTRIKKMTEQIERNQKSTRNVASSSTAHTSVTIRIQKT